jgi:hypothetical protein
VTAAGLNQYFPGERRRKVVKGPEAGDSGDEWFRRRRKPTDGEGDETGQTMKCQEYV